MAGESCGELLALGEIFGCARTGFGIGQRVAGGIDDGDASPGGLSFLSGDVGEGVAAAVGLDAVSQELGLLDEVTFNFAAQRSLPGAAEHEVEHNRGCEDDNQKGRHQLEENPVSHFFLTLGPRSGSPRRARS